MTSADRIARQLAALPAMAVALDEIALPLQFEVDLYLCDGSEPAPLGEGDLVIREKGALAAIAVISPDGTTLDLREEAR